MTNVNQTASDNAEEFGFHAGDLVQEWLWDDDVDDSIRAKIEELTGEELVDEDYDSAVDGVIIWWRDGDDEDELSDTIVDAYAVLGDDGPLWVLTPKPGRPGAASSSTVQSAAKTAGIIDRSMASTSRMLRILFMLLSFLLGKPLRIRLVASRFYLSLDRVRSKRSAQSPTGGPQKNSLTGNYMGAMEFLASCCIVGRVGGTRPAHRRRTPGQTQRERIRCPESGTKKRLKG